MSHGAYTPLSGSNQLPVAVRGGRASASSRARARREREEDLVAWLSRDDEGAGGREGEEPHEQR